MGMENQNPDWIKLRSKKKLRNAPSEIRIDINGNVYIEFCGRIKPGWNSTNKREAI